MQERWFIMAAIILTIAPRTDPLFAESISDRLEKGIFAEETAGDLDEAIATYEGIVAEAKSSRPFVAQALFRMAECYLKQGEKDRAITTFRQVVELFSDQRKISAKAKMRLDGLAIAHKPNAPIRLAYDDDSAEGKRSLAESGHAITFQRPPSAQQVVNIDLFASRYGHPQPPDEDFHIYLLDEKQKIIADLPFPYGMIERGDLRWYRLKIPPTTVPQKFYVALSFSPQHTKGIYLGYDESVKAVHSYTGLPKGRFKPVDNRCDWMVRVFLSSSATSGAQISEADKREAETLASQGWALWRQRKLTEAETMFQSSVDKDPTNPNAWIWSGLVTVQSREVA